MWLACAGTHVAERRENFVHIVRNTISAFALGAVLGAPLGMASAASSSHRDFEGTVVHVSAGNIKVHGIEGGKPQTLSFLLRGATFSKHGKGAAYKDIREGDMVKIRYDQKFLGARHADAVTDEDTGYHKKT
jgi:hypothetical protein